MAINEYRFDSSQILAPALPSPLNRLDPALFGNSLTVTRGQAVARKTSDGKFYPLNTAAADGTQTFAGFAQYSFVTDSSGNITLGFGSTPGNSFFTVATGYVNIYTGGIFDPADLLTGPASGTPTAEVSTVTPTNPTTGDIYTVTAPNGVAASFTVGATQTATATVTGLKNAWNSDPYLTGLGTASGTTTFIVTAVTPGQPLGLKATAIGTGTTALVVGTPSVQAAQAELDTFTPATVTTGDVNTLTINFPNGTTHAVSFTIAATQTATAAVTGLKAAWNADPVAANYATAGGTTTFTLTGPQGATLNVTSAVTGTGTLTKVVTNAAYGRNIADILPGCPGARVLAATGFWEVP